MIPMHVLYFRGKGPVAVGVRLITWEWWNGQAWDEVPAHAAIFWQRPDGVWIEIEAVITGIHRTELLALPTEGVVASFRIRDTDGRGWLYAAQQVGKRYGFETALATGLGAIPWWRALAARFWAGVGQGRTAPLHCSLLAQEVMRAAGESVPESDLPPSPNAQMLWLRNRR